MSLVFVQYNRLNWQGTSELLVYITKQNFCIRCTAEPSLRSVVKLDRDREKLIFLKSFQIPRGYRLRSLKTEGGKHLRNTALKFRKMISTRQVCNSNASNRVTALHSRVFKMTELWQKLLPRDLKADNWSTTNLFGHLIESTFFKLIILLVYMYFN